MVGLHQVLPLLAVTAQTFPDFLNGTGLFFSTLLHELTSFCRSFHTCFGSGKAVNGAVPCLLLKKNDMTWDDSTCFDCFLVYQFPVGCPVFIAGREMWLICLFSMQAVVSNDQSPLLSNWMQFLQLSWCCLSRLQLTLFQGKRQWFWTDTSLQHTE